MKIITQIKSVSARNVIVIIKMRFGYWFPEDPDGPWGFPTRNTRTAYPWASPGCRHPPPSSSLLPPSGVQSERKEDEPFRSSSRGCLFLRFTLVGATIQGLFWNVLGNSLSSKNLEGHYSKRGGGSDIPGSLLDMPVLESHPNHLK